MPCRGHIIIASPSHSQNYGALKRSSHFLMKRSLPPFCAACVFVLYLTIFLAHSPDTIAQRGDFSRDILKEDREFLDDLFQKMKHDDRTEWGFSQAPIQKIDNAGKMESSPKSVPRAVLVVNSGVVRRGQLVVHSEAVKRKRQNIAPWRRHAEVL